jgi:hypothetical protein
MSENAKSIEAAVGTILEVDQSSEAAAIPQLELVRRVLDFANTGRPVGLPGARSLTVGDQTFLVNTPDQDELHTELKRDLAMVVKGELSGPAVARLLKQARYVTVRRYELHRGTLRRVERQFVDDLSPVLADVLLLVRSDDRLHKDVRQCRLAGCGRFFLASDLVADASARGRRRHRYCSDEHMNLGQTPGSKRTAKWRRGVEQAKRQAAKKHK